MAQKKYFQYFLFVCAKKINKNIKLNEEKKTKKKQKQTKHLIISKIALWENLFTARNGGKIMKI